MAADVGVSSVVDVPEVGPSVEVASGNCVSELPRGFGAADDLLSAEMVKLDVDVAIVEVIACEGDAARDMDFTVDTLLMLNELDVLEAVGVTSVVTVMKLVDTAGRALTRETFRVYAVLVTSTVSAAGSCSSASRLTVVVCVTLVWDSRPIKRAARNTPTSDAPSNATVPRMPQADPLGLV